MLIVLIIGLTGLTFMAWFLIRSPKLRKITGTVTLLLLASCIGGLSANLAVHWGMSPRTTVQTTHRIYSAGPSTIPNNLIIVRRLGTRAQNYVLIYRTTATQSQPRPHFVPDRKQLATATKKRATFRRQAVHRPSVTTTRREWVFKSAFYARFLTFDHNDHQLISERTTVTVPLSWRVLTNQEARRVLRQTAH